LFFTDALIRHCHYVISRRDSQLAFHCFFTIDIAAVFIAYYAIAIIAFRY